MTNPTGIVSEAEIEAAAKKIAIEIAEIMRELAKIVSEAETEAAAKKIAIEIAEIMRELANDLIPNKLVFQEQFDHMTNGLAQRIVGHMRPLITIPAASVRASAPTAVPDGWKLVPVEPTVEMVLAGDTALQDCIDSSTCSRTDAYSEYIISGSQTTIYKAMLDATPSAPDAVNRDRLFDEVVKAAVPLAKACKNFPDIFEDEYLIGAPHFIGLKVGDLRKLRSALSALKEGKP